MVAETKLRRPLHVAATAAALGVGVLCAGCGGAGGAHHAAATSTAHTSATAPAAPASTGSAGAPDQLPAGVGPPPYRRSRKSRTAPVQYQPQTACPHKVLPGGPFVYFSRNGCRGYYAEGNEWSYGGGEAYSNHAQGYVVYRSPKPLEFIPVPGRTGMIGFYLAHTTYGCFMTRDGSVGAFFPRSKSFAFGSHARLRCPAPPAPQKVFAGPF